MEKPRCVYILILWVLSTSASGETAAPVDEGATAMGLRNVEVLLFTEKNRVVVARVGKKIRGWTEDATMRIDPTGRPASEKRTSIATHSVVVTPIDILKSYGGAIEDSTYIVTIRELGADRNNAPRMEAFDLFRTPDAVFVASWNETATGRERFLPTVPIPEDWVPKYEAARLVVAKSPSVFVAPEGADSARLHDLLESDNPFVAALACRALANSKQIDNDRVARRLLNSDGAVQRGLALILVSDGMGNHERNLKVIESAVGQATSLRSVDGIVQSVVAAHAGSIQLFSRTTALLLQLQDLLDRCPQAGLKDKSTASAILKLSERARLVRENERR